MADDITILLGARDNATKVVDSLAAKISALSSRKGLADLISFGGFAGAASLATRSLNALTDGMRAVHEGSMTVTQAMLGSIPVYGQLMKAASDLRYELDGTAQVNRDAAKAAEEFHARQTAHFSNLDTLTGLEEEAQLRKELAAAADEQERALITLSAEYLKNRDRLRVVAEDDTASVGLRERANDALRTIAENFTNDHIALMQKAAKEAADAYVTELEKSIAKEEKAFNAAASMREQLADLDSEITQARLKAIGDEEAAEKESIRRRYEARIRAAELAGEAEKAAKLKTLLALDLAEAGKSKGRGGPDITPTLRAIDTRSAMRAGGPADNTARATQATAKGVAPLAGKLDRIGAILDRIATQRGFNVEATL